MSEPTRIVIVGGGFAGVRCARTLRQKLPRDQYEIVIFNRENHMVFHPMLAEVAGGSLNPDAVAAPLRMMLPHVRCRTEDVRDVDLAARTVEYESHDGRLQSISYDHLVLASGSITNLGMDPGMADHAFPLKTVGDAVALRAHVMQQLEKAEVCDDPAKKSWYLTIVVVGGGFSGVEAAGEINDLARGSCKFFSNIDKSETRVRLIHARPQLLPEIGERLREFTREKMEQAGIDVLLDARVSLATPEGVGLADGREINGGTIICTIGTSLSPVIQKLDVPKERGRPLTDPDMKLQGRAHEWAIGDCANIINAHDGKPSPPTGQFAERQGRQVALNIVRTLKGQPTEPFRFKVLGQLCAIGGHKAVAEMFGMRISGFLAWFMWRSIYLMKLPSWGRRIRVGFDWFWQIIFSRDLSHLKTDKTERVSRAFYKPGDYVFREGDPAADFYVVQKGEVEVLRESPDGASEALAILGTGDFFGEMALITSKPRNASVRARTEVEVLVMGKHVFARISSSLAPLEELLASSVKRREAARWDALPAARKVLGAESVEPFLRPMSEERLHPEDSFAKAVSLFQRERLAFACVVDQEDRLVGVVTRSDFLRALQNGVAHDGRIDGFFTPDPKCVALADSALAAAGTMRDQGLAWLPVVADSASRRVVGTVEAQSLIARILESVAMA